MVSWSVSILSLALVTVTDMFGVCFRSRRGQNSSTAVFPEHQSISVPEARVNCTCEPQFWVLAHFSDRFIEFSSDWHSFVKVFLSTTEPD